MGNLDALSREFAREHSGRLWKQLVLGGGDEPVPSSTGWVEPLLFAGAAVLAVRFLTRRTTLHRLERWQTTYLPVFALWAASVVVVLPPVFAFD